jgi:hypothetical protein
MKVMSFAESAALATVENHRHGERLCSPVLRQPVKQFFPALRKVPQLNPGKGLVNSDQIIPIDDYLNRHWILDFRACFGFRASNFEFKGPAGFQC